MRFFLISDNSDAMNGLRLAGIEGTVARSEADLRHALADAANQPDIAVLLVTEKIAETYTATLDSARAAGGPLLITVPSTGGGAAGKDRLTRYIREETEREISSQLDATRKAENARVERTLHFETERARTRANRDLSAARMAARATLADQRQKIADETFAEARSQLVAFAAGDKYAAWLQNEAAALAEALGENANIAARPADLPLLQNVKLPVGTTLTADESIELGGLKGANAAKGLVADDTLAARLNAQHEWFLQNAGLEINI